MISKELHDLSQVSENTTSDEVDRIYNELFRIIANDHQGVYYIEKIELMDELVKLYYQNEISERCKKAISAMLNNLYYFQPYCQDKAKRMEIHQQLQKKLELFNDENFELLKT